MGKFAPEGSPYIPWTIDADQIGGVDVEQAMSPAPGDVLAYDGGAQEWQPTTISGAGGVPLSRTISTTAPLTGGGDLSANRTLAVSTFGAGSSGVVPSSGGGTINFLRADGTWTAPPGTGVTSVGASAPVTSSGGLTPTIGITDFTDVARGTVPASGGGTTNFLRADGTWTAPGGGTPVTSVSGSAPISSSGGTTPTISLDDNGVSNAKLRDSGALSVIGRSANSLGDPADISAVAASGAVLRESGSTIGFGQIATAGITDNAVTLAKLATQANYTWLGNISGGVAVPTATALVISTTTDPTVTDDSAAGRFVGQMWVNTSAGRTWVARDVTVGAAMWNRTGGPPAKLATDSGTKVIYDFDGNANDSSGAGRNLTMATSPWYQYFLGPGRRWGQFQGGTAANGTYVDAGGNLLISGSMSIEFIAFIGNTASLQSIVNYGPTATRSYLVTVENNANRASLEWGFYDTGSTKRSMTGTQFAGNAWGHWVLTRVVSGGNTTLTAYLNGTQIATQTFVGQVPLTGVASTLYVSRTSTGTTTENLTASVIGGIHISTYIPSAAEIKLRAQRHHFFPSSCT